MLYLSLVSQIEIAYFDIDIIAKFDNPKTVLQ